MMPPCTYLTYLLLGYYKNIIVDTVYLTLLILKTKSNETQFDNKHRKTVTRILIKFTQIK